MIPLNNQWEKVILCFQNNDYSIIIQMRMIKKIWLRFWVVFLIHLMIKSFDLSFPGGPFELNFRSLLFSLFFMTYGMFIWQTADYFNGFFQKLTQHVIRIRVKIAVLTFLHAILGFILSLSLNHFYRIGDIYLFEDVGHWEHNSFFNPELTIALTSIYLIILGFDGYFEMQQSFQNEVLKARELEKESILAQYKALKAQIEPHFLFNSLSVLSSLVYDDADLASGFIVKMSKTLRYIIEKNEFHLVKLSEELEFLDAYFFLIKTRFEEGVFLENRLQKPFVENTYIPPVTLQLLVENAVIHNKSNPENPLKITIDREEKFIVVKNNLNLRVKNEPSTQMGLKNISKRYELVSGQKVIILKTDSEFIVKIPSLNYSDYERFIV
ncbi:hypothetical protein D1164_13685 [Mariniphaga sediminis]|uniref:Signal transduction histidine kinase internal region domain-containing protein n=2 Tax=Mariniphaga sediminis TaxID=1628158 RepID=A0A399CZN3_9BACT|nr:hypothetical protein D1164_13685 [Mariniphaga sediminis]